MLKRSVLFSLGTALLLLSGCGSDKGTNQTEGVADSQGIVVTEGAVKALKKETNSKENSGQFYYSYNKEKKEDQYNSEESKIRTELDAYRDIKSPYERVQITLMIQQLSPDYRLLCSACHDDYANGIIGPSLLSRDSDYIYGKIADFKSGKKSNPLMNDLIKMMSDEEIRTLADEIYLFNQEIKKMREKK